MPPVSYILQIQPAPTVSPRALGLLLEEFRQQVNNLLEGRNWEACRGTRIRYRQIDLTSTEWTEGWWFNEANPIMQPLSPAKPSRAVDLNLHVLGERSPSQRALKRRRTSSTPPRAPKLLTPESPGDKSESQPDAQIDGENLLNQFCPLFSDLHGRMPTHDIFSRRARPTARSKIEKYPIGHAQCSVPDAPLTPPLFSAERQAHVREWLGLLDACQSTSSGDMGDSEESRKSIQDAQDASKQENGGCACLPTFA